MKKLNITKEQFEKSKYFTNKYGKLEYVSESGKLFKTDKGKLLKFKESKVDLKEDKPNTPKFKSWGGVEREIRAAIRYAKNKGQEACMVFDIGTWDQKNNKTLQEIIAKFKAKGYSCRPYPEEDSGYGIVDDGLGLSIVWGSFLESEEMKFKESTKKFGKKFKESKGLEWLNSFKKSQDFVDKACEQLEYVAFEGGADVGNPIHEKLLRIWGEMRDVIESV